MDCRTAHQNSLRSLAALLCLLYGAAGAQPLIAREFETCRRYAQSIAESNAVSSRQEEVASQLQERRDSIMDRINSTSVDFRKLVGLGQLKSFLLLENQILRSQIPEVLANPTSASNRADTPDAIGRLPMTRVTPADQQAIAVTLEGDFLEHQLKELDAAGRLLVQRRFRALQDLVAVEQYLASWHAKNAALAEQYWVIADCCCVRSRIEHQAGLRELRNADVNNAAANLARAMLHMHLDDYQSALESLSPIEDSAQGWPLATAVRGRVGALQGNDQLAKQCLKHSLNRGRQDWRVRLIRAQTLAVLGDYEASRAEWEVVLNSGKDQVSARRALALLYVSQTSRTPKGSEQAIEHARVASKLEGEQQWSCQIALALCLAAGGDAQGGMVLAKEAQLLAIGEQKLLCSDIAHQIEAGQHAVWNFR
jgi:tetratricopeptide (TPR) repeat protein